MPLCRVPDLGAGLGYSRASEAPPAKSLDCSKRVRGGPASRRRARQGQKFKQGARHRAAGRPSQLQWTA
ncbi:hypothetical protein FAIPA1_160001 [Frankia sp. AiPs1]